MGEAHKIQAILEAMLKEVQEREPDWSTLSHQLDLLGTLIEQEYIAWEAFENE